MKTFLQNNYLVLLLLLVSFLPLLALLHSGLPITHDGQDHVARIANFYTDLSEGIIVPRWAANLNWGYGHPILMFLYPFSSYSASLFHFFGFSFVDSVKLVFACAFVASGITMYLWVKQLYGPYAGFVAAVVYLFAPYRFVNLYVRGAIGEHVALVFVPLVLYFIHKTSINKSVGNIIGGALSFGALVLSHNAISLMFIPFFIIYIVYLSFMDKKNMRGIWIQSLLLIICGFALSAFFWLPAFVEGKYTLRDIVIAGGYVNRFVSWQSLFWGPWSFGGTGQFTVQIGFLNIFAILCSLVLIVSKRNRGTILPLLVLIYVLVAIMLMLPEAKFVWEKITLLQNFQFPWRFLNVTVFCSAILAGYSMTFVPKKTVGYIALLVCILALFFTKDYWWANGYLQKPESFYSGVYYGTTDTGESAPIWSIRFMEHTPKAPVEVITGIAAIEKVTKSSAVHTYTIQARTKSRIRENTLYFPGWNVFVDGQQTPIEFQDPANRGLMTYFVEKGNHSIQVVFSDTRLRLIASVISICALLILMLLFVTRRVKLWQRFLSY